MAKSVLKNLKASYSLKKHVVVEVLLPLYVSLTVHLYIRMCVTKTNFMHYLSAVYFVNQHLHVSSIFVAHHQEVCYTSIYTTVDTCCCVYIQYTS
jgi:hypothetical protein